MIRAFIIIIFILLLIVSIAMPQLYKSKIDISPSSTRLAPPKNTPMPTITYDPELVLICSNPNVTDARCEKFIDQLRSDFSISKQIINDLPDQETRDEFTKRYKPLLDQNSKLGKMNDNMQTTSTRIKNARQLILDIKNDQRISPPQK